MRNAAEVLFFINNSSNSTLFLHHESKFCFPHLSVAALMSKRGQFVLIVAHTRIPIITTLLQAELWNTRMCFLSHSQEDAAVSVKDELSGSGQVVQEQKQSDTGVW